MLDFVAQLGQSFIEFGKFIVSGLFAFMIIVFFHELGHFWVARRFRVKVESFSIGFGKRLFGFTDARGTDWKFSVIPLGGYVKFAGDKNPASFNTHDPNALPSPEERDHFEFKPVWQRALIVLAGPIANFLLAIVIFTGLFTTYGQYQTPPVIGSVEVGSAAERAGLQPLDRILRIDGHSVSSYADISQIIQLRAGETLTIRVRRDDREHNLHITPELRERTDILGKPVRIGFIGIRSPENVPPELRQYSPSEALLAATERCFTTISNSLGYLKRVITGAMSAEHIGGPGRAIYTSKKVFEIGTVALIEWIAILSIAIGVANLLPIPVLDGGHLVFLGYEALFRKRASERTYNISFAIGIAILISFMIFVNFNDYFYIIS